MVAAGMVRMQADTSVEFKLRKTQMCKYFQLGNCEKGNKCRFAHSHLDLQTRPNLYKTQLCLAFNRSGTCRDGQACKYAHGQGELLANLSQAPGLHADLTTQLDISFPQTMPTTKAAGFELVRSFPRQPVQIVSLTQEYVNARNGPLKKDIMTKHNKDYHTLSLQTTEAGPDYELESLCTTRQSSYQSESSFQSSISEGDPDSMSGRNATSVYSSEISKEVPLIGTEGVQSITTKTHIGLDHALKQTKMCKFFIRGMCTKGARCSFAHGTTSWKARPNLFRTSLCMAFERSGHCKMGDNCRYAHGKSQLQETVSRDGNYTDQMPVERASDASDDVNSFIQGQQSNPKSQENSDVVVIVKNTFIDFRPQANTARRHSVC